MTRASTNRRIVLLASAFLVVLGVALARAFWLQVVNGDAYAAMAVRQHRETIVVPAARGTIFDANGEPLAIGKRTTTVYANPQQVDRPRDLTLAVARALDLEPAAVHPLLIDRSRGFVYLARKVDPLDAEELEELGFAGLGFYPEELRTYPQGPVASQVLGYAGLDNKGLEGLERSLDKRPRGQARHPDGREGPLRTCARRRLDSAREPRAKRATHARHQIQANAEAVLKETVRRNGARAASAIVMDPHTGAILAMATAPGFNANRFPTTRADRRRNRAVTDTYEPGSTFKLVTVAAGLQEGIVSPSTSFRLPPTLQVADRVIRESHPRGTERMSVRRDRRALVEHRHDHDRAAARRGPSRELDRALRLRENDGHRLPR